MLLRKTPALRNISFAIVLFGVVMLCFIWAWLFHIVKTERQLAINDAFKETAAYARMFEEHTVRTIGGLDQIALFLKDLAEKDGLKIDLIRLMKEERFAGQPIIQLSLVDESGFLTASSILPAMTDFVGDRGYFKEHRDSDFRGLLISRPVLGRTSGKWSIQLTRRISKADGSFGGVVVVSVDPYYFAEFYKQVDLGKGASISVIGRDGTLRIRKSGNEISIGLDFAERVQNEFSKGKIGQYSDKSIVDGIRRFFSYRSISEYPLIVTVGVSEEEIYAALNDRAIGYYWICGLMSALIVLFIGILLWGMERRHRAEQALRESEERFRAYFRDNKSVMLLVDRETERIVDANPAAADYYGYPLERLTQMKASEINMLNQEDISANIQQAFLRQQNVFVLPHRLANGEIRQVEVYSTPIRIGSREKLLSIIHDITGRIQLEAENKEREENFYNFFNSIDDFLFVLDTQGCILRVNQTVLERLKYSQGELSGQSVLAVHSEEQREEAARTVQKMLAGETQSCMVPLVGKGGELIPVETRVTTGRWNGNPALFGISKDLSALKISEEKLNKVFQTTSALMVLSTFEEGIILDANAAFLKALGFAKHEVVGKRSTDLNVFASDEVRDDIRRRLRDEGSIHNQEIRLRAQSGSEMDGLLSIGIVDVAAHRLLITTVIDVTALKQAEEAIRSGRERYHALVEQSFEALALVDIDTQEVVEVNRRFTELLGYSLPEDAPLYVNKFVVDSQSNLDRIYREELRKKSVIAPAARIFRHKNGIEVPVERAGTVIHFEGRDIYLASMRDMTAERRRSAELLRDVELARQVQQDLLPKISASPFIDVRTLYYPSNDVSGDSYHLSWRGDGKLLRGFLVDVSGHGLGTALQTASINSLLQEDATAKLPLMGQMRRLNTRAGKYFSDGAYAAMLGFELDLIVRELRYVGAGITQFFVNGQEIEVPGMFVGLWENAEFTAGVIPIHAGDCIYFLTDGFTDVLSKHRPENVWSKSGKEFEADVAALERLAVGGTLRDDATGVCLKILL